MIQNKFATGLYIVDKELRIVNCNRTLTELYPDVKLGEHCYRALALQDKQCDICPLKQDNSLFYNPIRKEWIYANASEIDYPGYGTCYSVQFQLRQKVSDAGSGRVHIGDMTEHIIDICGSPDAAAIAGLCAPGSPLSFANERLLSMLGYSDIDDLSCDVDGLVFNTIHPDDVDDVTASLTDCALNGGTFETTFRMHRKDGSWFWVVSHGKRVEAENGQLMLLSVIFDMPKYVKQQQEIRMSLLKKELTSKAVLEHMPGGYHRCAKAEGWPFIYFGRSFEEITGWTKEEIKNEFGNLFINLVLEEDLPICASIIEAVDKYGYSNSVYRLKKKGGGYTWVSDSTMFVDLGEEGFYHGVLADVTEQIEQMEAAKKDAEASSLAKSTFLFNASHDIRTPMNAIQGFAHIIEHNADDPAIVKDSVRKLKQSGDILITLMNDILELSRIERGKEMVNERPLNMDLHVEKLNEMMISEMAAQGIEFSMQNDIKHPLVMGDDLKLSRIAMNLLSNAKKFTPAGGKVSFGVIESDYDGERAVYTLYVRDTGIGMSAEFQERAFEQFERERSSTDSGVSGSGLGLAIIKKIADLLGGDCVIKSELGKGTDIRCSIPMRLADESDLIPDIKVGKADFTGKRILIVEDNAFNREIAHYVFTSIGFEADEADNGVSCLEKITSAPAGYYDLVLMDIQMPVMDGYTATREIRAIGDPRKSSIPIIAMTANAFEEDRRKCLSLGMDGHIGKPLDAKAVLNEFMRIFSKPTHVSKPVATDKILEESGENEN